MSISPKKNACCTLHPLADVLPAELWTHECYSWLFGDLNITSSANTRVCGLVLPGLPLPVKSDLQVFNLKDSFSFA